MASTVLTTSLEVSGFAIPVKLRKVSVKRDVTFDRASPDGNPIGRVEIDKVTGEALGEDAEIQRGKFDGDVFHAVPQDSIDAITEQTKLDTFAVTDFISLKDVPFERANDAYFLAPDGNGRPLKLIYEAMRKTKKAGIGKLVLRSRQQPFVIYPAYNGVFLLTLSFAEDFKQADEAGRVLEGVTVEKAHVDQAVMLIENLSSEAEALDTLTDDLIPLKAELIEKALAGQKIANTKKAGKAAVAHDGLMDALRASVDEAEKRKGSRKGTRETAGV
jgi:DNA end-binding protein Ku